MLNAQSTATERGRNPDMHRDIPTPSLLAPQPNVREKTSAAGEHHAPATPPARVHLTHKTYDVRYIAIYCHFIVISTRMMTIRRARSHGRSVRVFAWFLDYDNDDTDCT